MLVVAPKLMAHGFPDLPLEHPDDLAGQVCAAAVASGRKLVALDVDSTG
jgi:hypothetical protein